MDKMPAENAEKSRQFLRLNRKLRQPLAEEKAAASLRGKIKKCENPIPGPSDDEDLWDATYLRKIYFASRPKMA